MTQQTAQTVSPLRPESQSMQVHNLNTDQQAVPAKCNLNYFQAPDVVSTGVTEAKLREKMESHLAVYVTRRTKLEEVTNELTRLRKTLSALNKQGEQADENWRHDFVKGFGKQSKAVRDQLRQKTQWKLEAEDIKEMITLLEPQVEWLKMHTFSARQALQFSQRKLADLTTYNDLMASLDSLAASDEMAKLSGIMPRIFDQIETATYNDVGYMIQLGLDVARKPGKSIKMYLSNADTRHANREIRLRQYAALGELLVNHLPVIEDQVGSSSTELPTPLACEASQGDYQSALGFSRRLKELEAQMGYTPSLDDLDNA